MSDTRTPTASPLALAVLSAGAAAIHFGAMSSHFGRSLTHGVFFAVVGWAQLAWAAAVLARAGRGAGQKLLLAGAFFNLAVLTIWLVGTTAGLPFGPGAWLPQPITAPDLVGALLEIILIAGTLVRAERETPWGTEAAPAATASPGRAGPVRGGTVRAVLSRARRPLARRLGVATLSGLVTVAVVASFTPSIATSVSTTLAAWATDNSDAQAGHDHHHHHHHHHGAAGSNAGSLIGDPGTEATEAQIAAANELVRVALDEVPKRWPTARDAEEDGYQTWTNASGVRQLAKPELIDDGVILDPTRPEALIYHDKPDGSSVLLGVVYIMPPDLPAPDIGGPLTPWYQNPTPCFSDSCSAKGGLSQMLRIWLVDFPGGPFAPADGAALQTAIARLNYAE